MTKSGLSIQAASKSNLGLVPIVESARRPTQLDTQYPTGTEWRVSVSSETHAEGEIWKLTKFEQGKAMWRRINFADAGPGIAVIATENGEIAADGAGRVKVVDSEPTDAKARDWFEARETTLLWKKQKAQTATEKTMSPHHLGLSAYDERDFEEKDGLISLQKSRKAPITEIRGQDYPLKGELRPGEMGEANLEANLITHRGLPCRIERVSSCCLALNLQGAGAGKKEDSQKLAGLASFDERDFEVDEFGHASLKDKSRSIKSIIVDSGLNNFDPTITATKYGSIRLSSRLSTNPAVEPIEWIHERESTATLQLATATNDRAGLVCPFEEDFDVDGGLLSLRHVPYRAPGTVYNVKIEHTEDGITLVPRENGPARIWVTCDGNSLPVKLESPEDMIHLFSIKEIKDYMTRAGINRLTCDIVFGWDDISDESYICVEPITMAAEWDIPKVVIGEARVWLRDGEITIDKNWCELINHGDIRKKEWSDNPNHSPLTSNTITYKKKFVQLYVKDSTVTGVLALDIGSACGLEDVCIRTPVPCEIEGCGVLYTTRGRNEIYIDPSFEDEVRDQHPIMIGNRRLLEADLSTVNGDVRFELSFKGTI